MGVVINPDATIDEFVVPRHKVVLSNFVPKECLGDCCEIIEGEGTISLLAQLEFQSSNINIFAWEKGAESNTNQYDFFPPPIDTDVLYGTMFVFRTNRRSGIIQSLTADLFQRYIETCHHGFEDLGSDDSEDDENEDEDEIPTREDIEFIDNQTLDEIEDDASISAEESEADEDETESETEESEAEEDESNVKEPEFE